MNASLYISFFQGQLESALEQVVQLAVREITGTVGASLSSMLLETARKEQENQRLRASIQSGRGDDAERGNHEVTEDIERESEEQRVAYSASQLGSLSDSLRLEHKRRAVGELKQVMERVLEFGVCELSKIVEDSFDDVLLEFRKTEQENEELKKKLHTATNEQNGIGDTECEMQRNQVKKNLVERNQVEVNLPERNQVEENRVVSTWSSTEFMREEERRVEEEKSDTKQIHNTDGSAPSVVVSGSQDWVPVLNKVFGEAWCGDVWPLKEASEIKTECISSEGLILEETKLHRNHHNQSEWLSDSQLTTTLDLQQTPVSSATADEEHLKSPSMLQRLLTLPAQLLDGDEDSMESEDSLINAVISSPMTQSALDADTPDAKEPKHKIQKTRKKIHTCKTCGERFNRAHQLRTHMQTHRGAVLHNKGHAHVRSESAT